MWLVCWASHFTLIAFTTARGRFEVWLVSFTGNHCRVTLAGTGFKTFVRHVRGALKSFQITLAATSCLIFVRFVAWADDLGQVAMATARRI